MGAQLTFHVSPLTSHVSRLTSHVSPLTSHVSRFTSHLSPVPEQSGALSEVEVSKGTSHESKSNKVVCGLRTFSKSEVS